MALPNEPRVSSPKERKEILSRLFPKEKYPLVEPLETPEVPPELEKVEAVAGAEISLPQPVTDDSGAVIVDTPTPQKVTVTLPLTEDEIIKGLGYKITYSVRWLAERCKRLLKIVGGRFFYRFKK
jgi:hypothetical protein